MANSFNEKDGKLSLMGYYYGLPDPSNPKVDFKLEVMSKCKITEGTFFNWISGRTRPSDPKHLAILSEITGIKEEDLWQD
jgi:hypothetical protein